MEKMVPAFSFSPPPPLAAPSPQTLYPKNSQMDETILMSTHLISPTPSSKLISPMMMIMIMAVVKMKIKMITKTMVRTMLGCMKTKRKLIANYWPQSDGNPMSKRLQNPPSLLVTLRHRSAVTHHHPLRPLVTHHHLTQSLYHPTLASRIRIPPRWRRNRRGRRWENQTRNNRTHLQPLPTPSPPPPPPLPVASLLHSTLLQHRRHPSVHTPLQPPPHPPPPLSPRLRGGGFWPFWWPLSLSPRCLTPEWMLPLATGGKLSRRGGWLDGWRWWRQW